jgi:hypothetical protein
MTINLLPFHEEIEVIRSYTLLEITYYGFNLRSYNQAQIPRYTIYSRRSGSSEYDTDHYSGHYSEQYSEIPNHASTRPSSNAEYYPQSDHESHSYKADTAHTEALRD